MRNLRSEIPGGLIMFADCPTCDQPIEVDHVHNGIGMTWHAVHCGWGHEFASKDVYEAYSAADLAEVRARRGKD